MTLFRGAVFPPPWSSFPCFFGIPCFFLLQGIFLAFWAFSLLTQGFYGFGKDKKSLFFGGLPCRFPKKPSKGRYLRLYPKMASKELRGVGCQFAFLEFLAFLFCKDFLAFSRAFPFFPGEFMGSPRIKNPCFWWLCLPFSKRPRKGRPGYGRVPDNCSLALMGRFPSVGRFPTLTAPFSGKEKYININKICGIVPGLGGCRKVVYVFFFLGSFLMGKEKTHKQNPPQKSRDNPVKCFFTCFFLYVFFFAPKFPRMP